MDKPTGRIRITAGGRILVDWTNNALLYTWAAIASHRLTVPDSPYLLNTIYLEYENVGDVGDVVSTPSVSRDAGLNYYASLLDVPDRDYLRLPIVGGPSFGTIVGTEGNLPDGQYNLAVVRAMTAGFTAGEGGVAFGAGSQSKLCGMALASSPVRDDPSADIIYGRVYWDAGDQVVAPSGLDLTVEYEITFP